MAIKDYCIGCYWKFNNECIRGKGDYCPASSIKAERRKQRKQEAKPMRIRAAYGTVKGWLSSFEVGEVRKISQEYSWKSIKTQATRLREDYGIRFTTKKLGPILAVTRVE